MKFGDHEVTSTPVNDPAYVQHLVWFPNGYGASIIRFGTWAQDHWELAVIEAMPDDDFVLVFDHPEVEGSRNLSPIEVGRLLDRIKELQP